MALLQKINSEIIGNSMINYCIDQRELCSGYKLIVLCFHYLKVLQLIDTVSTTVVGGSGDPCNHHDTTTVLVRSTCTVLVVLPLTGGRINRPFFSS